MDKLIKELDKMIDESGENVSVLVKEIGKKEDIYNYNSNVEMVSASIIKVPIMLAILENVRMEKIKLNDEILVKQEDILYDTEIFENGEGYYSIYELINWMIIKSDNTATNVLIKEFGMESINNYIINVLKLKSTRLERYMLDKTAIKNGFNNYINHEDMLNIFTKLFNKEILNKKLCNIAIEILYNQRCQNQIMRHIYQPVKFAHKTGTLDYLSHDVGVMNINNRLFYIGVSVFNSKFKDGNKKLIGNIGKIIYDALVSIQIDTTIA